MESTFAGIPVKVEYKKTSRLSMTFDKGGTLIVTVPHRATEEDIIRFLGDHRRWIRIHYTKAMAFAEEHADIRIEDGGLVPYLGTDLKVRIGGRSRITRAEDEIIFPDGSGEEEYIAWLKKKAHEYLPSKLALISESTGIPFRRTRISGARKSWGSCSPDGTISLSWRLMMCPPEAIDYVIVHELCHRLHMDHSKEFWAEVESRMPDYRVRRKWLDDNAFLMDLFG